MDLFDKLVVATYGTGGIAFVGKCIGHVAQPTYIIQLDDGTLKYWVQSAVRAATLEEEVVHLRAKLAEPQRPKPPNIRVECDHLFLKRRNCPGCYEGVEPGKEPYR